MNKRKQKAKLGVKQLKTFCSIAFTHTPTLIKKISLFFHLQKKKRVKSLTRLPWYAVSFSLLNFILHPSRLSKSKEIKKKKKPRSLNKKIIIILNIKYWETNIYVSRVEKNKRQIGDDLMTDRTLLLAFIQHKN